MTTLETDKKMEEKKYSQLTRESISVLADSDGFYEISDQVAGLLAEDVNYRLRETIQNAAHLMRHAKRRKLKTEDISISCKWSNLMPLYGYSNPEPMKIVYVKEFDVFSTENNETDLSSLATSSTTITLPDEPSIKVQWLAVEGIPLHNGPATSNSSSKRKNSTVIPVVSDVLMAYYDQITKTILGSDEDLLKIAFEDLQTNFKIAPLLPYLVNFVSVGVKKMSHDLTQLSKLLQTVHCLFRNQSLYLGTQPYLVLLVQSVLYCILEPLAASINPINDHWTLRDSAAQLLALILGQWSNGVNNLKFQTLESLRDAFCDLSKPFSTHYGAAVAILALGIKEAKIFLYSRISHYWPHLERALMDSSYGSAQLKSDAHKVHGVLLLVGELLIRSYKKFEDTMPEEPEFETHTHQNKKIKMESDIQQKNPKQEHIYDKMYEFFGDALAARLPCSVRLVEDYPLKARKSVNLFDTPELHLTGEELLETFHEKEDDVRSNNNSIEEYNSEDENSGMSCDDHEGGVGSNVELQIRSTISDPALGIKLTIAKLRRGTSTENTASSTKKLEETKVPKKKLKVVPENENPDPVFDYTHWNKKSSKVIQFNFIGAKPIADLRRKSFSSASEQSNSEAATSSLLEFDTTTRCTLTNTWKMALKLKYFGKKRPKDNIVVKKMKMYSANLGVTI